MLTCWVHSAKRLVAAWRVLVGVWMPKRWELSLAALEQYTTPSVPKESIWIDRPKTAIAEALAPPQNNEPPVKTKPKRRPPSRRIIRHVLRARAEAVRALASFFDQLDKGGSEKRINASAHLARAYGSFVEADLTHRTESTEDGIASVVEPHGWRSATEVIAFLRQRGAKIPTLGHDIEGEWAALSSDGEGEGSSTPAEEKADIVWVSGQQE